MHAKVIHEASTLGVSSLLGLSTTNLLGWMMSCH